MERLKGHGLSSAFHFYLTLSNIQSKIINGHNYEVRPFPATQGIGIFLQLSELLGPTIGGALTGEIKELSDVNVGSAVTELVKHINVGKYQNLITELMSTTVRDGKAIAPDFEIHYAANYGELLAALAHIITANFFSNMKLTDLDIFKKTDQE